MLFLSELHRRGNIPGGEGEGDDLNIYIMSGEDFGLYSADFKGRQLTWMNAPVEP